MDSFVTLSKCFSPVEAHLLKNILENEDIFCQIVNETISQIYNFHTPSNGGIVLKVHRRDFEKATEILHSNIRADLLTENLWNTEVYPNDQVDKNHRPNLYKLLGLLLFFAALLLVVKFFGK